MAAVNPSQTDVQLTARKRFARRPDDGGSASGARAVDTAPAPSGSSFYAAMRVLPRDQRHAMYAIYEFCRSVDDVADGPGAASRRIAALEQWRDDVDSMFRGAPPPSVARLAPYVPQYRLQRDDFHAIIDGMEMDAREAIVAPDLATLDLYSDRVASAVGRLSVRVFGLHDRDGVDLAFHLGRALQLTNILRDVDEDACKERVYLPREALDAAGIAETDVAAIVSHPAIGRACAWVADRAFGHFQHAKRIMLRYPLRVVRAPMLMAKVYESILERLLARGFAPPRLPVRANRATLLWTLVRYGFVPSRAVERA